MDYRRFVAVGDSLTQGRGDVYPDGRLRGFADLLAHGLRAVTTEPVYANLARPSVRVHEVLTHQVPHAVAFRPDLITALAGVNDIIAVQYPRKRVARQIDRVFSRLRAGAPRAMIVTATMPDLGHLSIVARMARSRVQALNDATRSAAQRHGVLLVDLEAQAPMTKWELSLDRVHPSPFGHVRFANAFATALGIPCPAPEYLSAQPRAEHLLRVYRTAALAPMFVTKRMARRTLIARQPAKRPELLPV